MMKSQNANLPFLRLYKAFTYFPNEKKYNKKLTKMKNPFFWSVIESDLGDISIPNYIKNAVE